MLDLQQVNENYKKINAESQINDPDSVRSFYKKLIALRKNPEYKETVVYGALEPVWEEVHNLMAYYRKGDRTLLVVGNYQKEPQTIELAGECKKILINNYDHAAIVGNKIELQGYQFLVLEILHHRHFTENINKREGKFSFGRKSGFSFSFYII